MRFLALTGSSDQIRVSNSNTQTRLTRVTHFDMQLHRICQLGHLHLEAGQLQQRSDEEALPLILLVRTAAASMTSGCESDLRHRIWAATCESGAFGINCSQRLVLAITTRSDL